MHVLSVVGARPQFIKAFALSRSLRRSHRETLVHTGQHYDEEMSDVFFDELGIPEPDYNLGVGSDTHGRQTAEMLRGIEELVEDESPDAVLLYGDTNSTLAGAIAGAKVDPVVAHVEAGLRSFNRDMPEEINRVLTDHASEVLFAPSEEAVENLRAENVTDGVFFVGDLMYDAILWARDVARDRSTVLMDLDMTPDEFVLSTIHRAANTDDPDRLHSIVNGLSESSDPVVFPAHPRTVERLSEHDLLETTEQELEVVEPLGYLDFVRLLDVADCVVTDSGGVQKEAFFLDTQCITVRPETEWVETVDAGWNTLVDADSERLQREITREWTPPGDKPEPYGDGDAASKITETLEQVLE